MKTDSYIMNWFHDITISCDDNSPSTYQYDNSRTGALVEQFNYFIRIKETKSFRYETDIVAYENEYEYGYYVQLRDHLGHNFIITTDMSREIEIGIQYNHETNRFNICLPNYSNRADYDIYMSLSLYFIEIMSPITYNKKWKNRIIYV
jgi:hypothetical protein